MKSDNNRLKFVRSVRMNHMLPYILTFIVAIGLIIILLSGCGSSSVDDNVNTDDAKKEKGIFIDSAVEGLLYIAGNISSFTDADGGFRYEEGNLVSFYIGDIRLGTSTVGDDIVTPLDLVSNGTIDDDEVLNIARFLQSLDIDPQEDHIKIPMSVHKLAGGQSLSFSSATFDDDAEEVLSILTQSNKDYATIPALVSTTAAKTHLANSLALETVDDDVIDDGPDDDDIIDDGTDADDDSDIPDDGNYETDEGYGTIQPFTETELAGDWKATVKNKKGTEYNFYYSFSSDGTGTASYPAPYPYTEPQNIEWDVDNEGRILLYETYNDSTETTCITRYTNGDVVWTTIEGTIAFRAKFIKEGSGDDDTSEPNPFVGDWTAIDSGVEEGQSSEGKWTIVESNGTLYVSGTWTAVMENASYQGMALGDVTIKFPFTNEPATVSSGAIAFTATGTASASTPVFPQTLKSEYTLVVSNATTNSCDYKISVTADLWKEILPPGPEGYNYIGSASVTIE